MLQAQISSSMNSSRPLAIKILNLLAIKSSLNYLKSLTEKSIKTLKLGKLSPCLTQNIAMFLF